MPAWGQSFESEDRVEIDVLGNGQHIITGTVVGISSQHLLDFYIVFLDKPVEGFNDASGKPWMAATFPNTLMKKLEE